jgi:hypothetical protein
MLNMALSMKFQYSVQVIRMSYFKIAQLLVTIRMRFYDSRLLTASYCIAFVIAIYSTIIALSWRGAVINSKQLNRVAENDNSINAFH